MNLLVITFVNLFLTFADASGEPEAIQSNPNERIQLLKYKNVQHFSKSKEWLKLNHYKVSLFNNYSSEIDGVLSNGEVHGGGYFASKEGRTNPEAELRADLDLISSSQNKSSDTSRENLLASDLAPECLMPARFLILQKHFDVAKSWKMPKCPKYDHFRTGINAISATLVFSSYYINNPSSAFGHTFIRLNKKSHSGEHHPLLDYGIGFAATGPESNGLSFALGGIFGWFKGDFTNVPYYFKVQEYNNFESRDLWEYELNLTQDEVDVLVAHFWELAQSKIIYRYLSANCASLLISSLEAAAPRLELRKHLPYWTIPSDVVHTLFQSPSLVSQIHFRPSKRTQFNFKFNHLTNESKNNFENAVKSIFRDTRNENNLSLASAAELDTLIDYLDFKYFREINLAIGPVAKFKQDVLVARSKITEPSISAVPLPELERPEAGHGSSRTSFGIFNSQKNGSGLLLAQRFALHDHLDAQIGFPRDAEIFFFDFLLHAKPSELSVDHIYAFKVQSSSPFEKFIPNFSWKVRLGAEKTRDQTCNDCLAAVAGGSFGYTLDLLKNGVFFSTVLVSSDLSIGDFGQTKIKPRIGPELNLRVIFKPNLIYNFNMFYSHIFAQNTSDALFIKQELRYSFKSTLPLQSNFQSIANSLAIGSALNHYPGGERELIFSGFFYY